MAFANCLTVTGLTLFQTNTGWFALTFSESRQARYSTMEHTGQPFMLPLTQMDTFFWDLLCLNVCMRKTASCPDLPTLMTFTWLLFNTFSKFSSETTALPIRRHQWYKIMNIAVMSLAFSGSHSLFGISTILYNNSSPMGSLSLLTWPSPTESNIFFTTESLAGTGKLLILYG